MRRFALLFCVSFLFATAAFAGPGAMVREVSGRADWRRGNAGAWQPVSGGLHLLDGDQLFTGPNGTVLLALAAGQVTLQPLTRAFLAHTQQGEQLVTARIDLQLGTLVARVNPGAAATRNITVSTPAGWLGIRGSESKVSYAPDLGLRVEHLDGEAGYTTVGGRTGELIPGQNAAINPAGLATPALDATREQALPQLLPPGSDPGEVELDRIIGSEPQVRSEPPAAPGAETGFSGHPERWYYDSYNNHWYYY